MEIIYYSKLIEGPGTKIRDMIESQFPEADLDVHQSTETLVLRLCRPFRPETVAVLTVADREDLTDLVNISIFLKDLRIILVLPSRNIREKSWAILRPRFTAYLTSDYVNVEVASALKGMHEILSYYKSSMNRWPFRLKQRPGLR